MASIRNKLLQQQITADRTLLVGVGITASENPFQSIEIHFSHNEATLQLLSFTMVKPFQSAMGQP